MKYVLVFEYHSITPLTYIFDSVHAARQKMDRDKALRGPRRITLYVQQEYTPSCLEIDVWERP